MFLRKKIDLLAIDAIGIRWWLKLMIYARANTLEFSATCIWHSEIALQFSRQPINMNMNIVMLGASALLQRN